MEVLFLETIYYRLQPTTKPNHENVEIFIKMIYVNTKKKHIHFMNLQENY